MIYVSDIIRLENPNDFKAHFARYNGHEQPLEVLARSETGWKSWQEYRPNRDEFSRPRIFSLVKLHYLTDKWLFGGIWDILERLPDRYVVRQSTDYAGFIGRLVIDYAYRQRGTRVNLENHFTQMQVFQVMEEPYRGQPFPGYSSVDLSFEELETIIRNDRPDWRTALVNVKGIYLITDTSTGRRYVGSAYGTQGIWSRWCNYVGSGHGGNVELRELAKDADLSYCRANFRIALIEDIPFRESDEHILAREGFWKRLLLTRGQYGLNRN